MGLNSVVLIRNSVILVMFTMHSTEKRDVLVIIPINSDRSCQRALEQYFTTQPIRCFTSVSQFLRFGFITLSRFKMLLQFTYILVYVLE